ncbi:MAG TPA: winged helix-turn-helix domain-containing protein [Gaiellaceae bacterium]|jgi:DNA-binding transcriptional ArsR family regulator|nr:winged helix-turn-helix domain-containing protein [Gaiellaceae bacterium]
MVSAHPTAAANFTIDRPEQLKALGHPLRLKVLQALGDSERPLTNRDLAEQIGVDPGHLHFHVRMLHRTGLIELAEGGRGREKPYRPVASHLKVSQEFRAAGLAAELQAAMLEEVGRGWDAYGSGGEFRAAQLNVRLSGDVVRELLDELIEKASELEDESEDMVTMTVIAHPKTGAPPVDDAGPSK